MKPVKKVAKQEEAVQYGKYDILDAQLQPVLPGFSRKKVPVFAQINAQELHEKLTRKVEPSIRVSRVAQGFNHLEQLCENVMAEGNTAVTGFVIAERGECVQFCCLVNGSPKSFPLRRELTTPCD